MTGIDALRAEVGALAARVGELARRLEALERRNRAPAPSTPDQRLLDHVGRITAAHPITAADVIREASRDLQLRAALDDAFIDDSQQLGMTMRRLERAGLVERAGARGHSGLWRVRSGNSGD